MQIMRCAIAGVLALLPAAARAAEQAVSQPMDKVQVTGSKLEQRRQETASTLLVGHEELMKQGDRSLAEALKRIPGISLGDGGGGKGSEIRMRGLGSGYVQILLNGMAVPNGFSLDSIAPDLIERVEVVQAASAELGTQGIAGTINIVLRKVASRPVQELKLTLGRQWQHLLPGLNGQISGKTDSYSYLLGLDLQRSVEDEPRMVDDIQYGRQGGLTHWRIRDEREINSANILNLSPRISWNLGEGETLTSQNFIGLTRRKVAISGQERLIAGDTGEYPDGGSVFRAKALMLRSDLHWQRELAAGGGTEYKLGIQHNPRRTEYDFGGHPSSPGLPLRRHVSADVNETGVTASGKYAARPNSGHALSAGWELAHLRRSQDRLENEFFATGAVRPVPDERFKGSSKRFAAYLQDEWDLSTAWAFSLGLRGELLETTVQDRQQQDISKRSPILSPILQAAYKPSAEHKWRAGIARTYKAPTMAQLFPRRFTIDANNSAVRPDIQGNPDLRPERAWGLDAGYERYVGKNGLLAASVFLRRIDDVILPLLVQEGTRWIATPTNQGQANVHGFTLEAKLPLASFMADAPPLALNANLTRNWSRVKHLPGPDNRLAQQQPVSANLGLEYSKGQLDLGADFNYQGGGRARIGIDTASVSPTSRELDVYGVWKLENGSRLRIGISNLLHRDQVSREEYLAQAFFREQVSTARSGALLRITYEFGKGKE
ncbi:TonB-dependent siderophore receptor [Massilia sp. erpn]|uniref:TonB-dependent receptor plug domain-containing protein n=1 Tax=Massilia sp. erpn TaxID=2738142 RepID=UPI00210757BE|nr:TonB-dependent receptor [Massilia sp. erpn]UTY59289.1 TonB-dependent receptor [Massilia sp. erpn]